VWANVAPKTALAPPSLEAKRQLACKSVDLESGEVQGGGAKGITECFRIDRNGQVIDTQYNLVSREGADAERGQGYSVEPNPNPFGNRYYDQRRDNGYYYYAPRDSRLPQPYFGQYGRDPRVQPPRDPYGREYQTPQRIDPGYIWGNRRYY
jgi:hypothetical protein